MVAGTAVRLASARGRRGRAGSSSPYVTTWLPAPRRSRPGRVARGVVSGVCGVSACVEARRTATVVRCPAIDLTDRCAVVTSGGHGSTRAVRAPGPRRRWSSSPTCTPSGPRRSRRGSAAPFVGDVGDPRRRRSGRRTVRTDGPRARVLLRRRGSATASEPCLDARQGARGRRRRPAAHVGHAAGAAGHARRGSRYLVQTISSAALITGPSPMGYTHEARALGSPNGSARCTRPRDHRHVPLPNTVNTGVLGRDEDDEDGSTVPRRRRGQHRRRRRARAGGRHGARRDGPASVPRAPASPRRRVVPAEGGRLRPLARGTNRRLRRMRARTSDETRWSEPCRRADGERNRPPRRGTRVQDRVPRAKAAA